MDFYLALQLCLLQAVDVLPNFFELASWDHPEGHSKFGLVDVGDFCVCVLYCFCVTKVM